MSGDVHPHPGPIKYPCSVCERPVAKNQHALQCDSCDQWVHIKCDGITKQEYKQFQEIKHLIFECPKCNLFTFTDSFFNASGESIDLSNSFQALSDLSDKPNNSMDSTIDSVTTNQSQHKRGLRIMSVNCRSLISSTKHLDLQNLIETHNPDIILGCESHLDPQIASSEVFPINYSNPYRKDRKLGEGGVFIAAKSDLITTEINIKTDCEIVWATLTVQGSFPIYIGSYYRRPSSKTDMIEELEKSIEQITSKVKNNMPHIILGGDFNLPDINWDNTTVNTNPQYGQEINSKLVEIVTENDFIQMVKEPTRGKNILDLILTNNPGLIERTQTQPGMSDHEIVITDINIKAKTYRKKPRNVYIYKKADMNSLQNDIDQAFTDHLKNKDKLTNSVEDNWIFFKDTILNSVNKHVPQKTISGKQDVPWMNHTIKRLIRKRQRRYNTAKNYDTSENWKKYRKARDIVKQTMTEAHDKYIRGILNEDSTNEEQKKPTMGKKFWQYIKSRKKDTVNISTLKNSSGTEVIDSKGKAAILNEQYDSVFTDEE
ncbi:Hypothetical predicted protein [Mytilus galloprovincialis]|uniref:PHD-type domain-containing protein n=1 Tax=Mytilus galloprovincialis TaxID=29158 RepID=A0A8B6ERU4_MYTGA|nr:Hypothetical predicted protein [Mytilus galloprovincialis]